MDSIAPAAVQETALQGFRLSPQQRFVWLRGRRETAIQGVIGLHGSAEPPAIKAAVRRVVQRHEALRTRIQGRPGVRVPLQVILDSAGPFWDCADLRATPETELPDALDALLREESSRLQAGTFEGPSCRFVLVERSPATSFLVVSLPALLADSRSLACLVAEIAAAYQDPASYEAGFDDTVQYLQFSEWRNEVVTEEEAVAGARHWSAVESLCRPVRLPIARDAGIEDGLPARGTAKLSLQGETLRLVDAAVSQGSATTDDWLLAAWAGLLCRWTGEPGVMLVHTLDGRKFKDLDGVVGLLASPVPLHLALDASFRLSEVVDRAAEAVQEASRWQEYFQPDESRALSELPAAGFSFEEWPETSKIGELALSLLERRLPHQPWQLDLTCMARDGGVEVELRYDLAMYSPEDAAVLLSQWEALLRSGLAAPGNPLRDLDLLGEAERRQILVDLNSTTAEPLAAGTVHELFTRAARAVPDAPAVICGKDMLTYRELEARANRLAHRLIQLGVRPEDRVGLYLDRSARMIVALLGTLKAGAAYVPLDPGLPLQRTAALLEEAGVRVLVVDGVAAPEIREATSTVLDLAEFAAPAAGPEEDPGVPCRPENLAYVLFTSGSTGRPKGVAVEHRQLLNYLRGIQDRLCLEPAASYAMISSFAADLGNTALFPALCQGGCLHVIEQEAVSDPALLAESFARHPVDCLKIVPSHLSALLDSANPQAVLPQRLLVLGGEAASRDLVARITRIAPDLRVLNHYGPTETTVGVMTCPAETGLADPRLAALALGRPIHNVQIYIADDRLFPVPVGMAGELLVGGNSVTRGYLGRPELTAERFLPDPFSGLPGARLYRTGDLVRHLPGGAIRFEGRTDHQVKIRGFRVELGEIEVTLRLDPAVRDAVAAVREDEAGKPLLVAYVVPRRNTGLDVRRLRQTLRERLPEAMVPAALVTLEQLPLNTNGKVDRKALPAPEAVEPGAGQRFVAPRTLGEEMLAGLWTEILGVENVGIHDSFFELGGHSLLATQLISRVRKAFDVDLPLTTFFDHPTVAALADRVEQARRGGATITAPPLEPVSREGGSPLSFAQERLWFMSQLDPASSAYNVPRSVRLLGPLDIAAVSRAFAEIGQRHEVLRTTFVPSEGMARQLVAPSAGFAPVVVDLGGLPEAERESEAARLAVAEARRPFDLTAGPLVRLVLVRFSDTEHIALMTMHHIVSDAWSMGVFLGELAEIYDALTAGRTPQLEELPIQYADYAAWQRRWLVGGALENELAFWRRALAGSREEVLPTDFERPPQASFRGEVHSRVFDGDLVRSLQELSRREGTTLFMTLLAGFKALLHRQTGADDVVVGTDVANRNRVELESLIGFFVNNLVLRTRLDGAPTFLEILKRVRKTTLDAFSHQDLPFDQLVKALNPKRVPGRTPLFQVLFVLQNAPRKELKLTDITLQPFDLGSATSKFDLALFVTQEGGGLTTTWSYRPDLFSRATIHRLAERLEALLRSACRAPEKRLGELEIDGKARGVELQAGEDARLARLRSIRRKGASSR